ncbi:MAG: hypothetical protein RLZ98_3179, partial [Pseudomonadota bacterium]
PLQLMGVQMLTRLRLHPNAQLATVPLIEADAREYGACGESGDKFLGDC